MVPCESWDLGQTCKQVLHTNNLRSTLESVLPIIRQRTSILSAISHRAEGQGQQRIKCQPLGWRGMGGEGAAGLEMC